MKSFLNAIVDSNILMALGFAFTMIALALLSM